jgi:hypothetical protein
MDKPEMQTANFTEKNFATLTKLFPNTAIETIDENGWIVRVVDDGVLRQETNMYVTNEIKPYSLMWLYIKKPFYLLMHRLGQSCVLVS